MLTDSLLDRRCRCRRVDICRECRVVPMCDGLIRGARGRDVGREGQWLQCTATQFGGLATFLCSTDAEGKCTSEMRLSGYEWENRNVFSELSKPLKYPVPYSRTKRCQPFLNYALAHFQNSK